MQPMSDYRPMTPERIFEIIKKKGAFIVHRYSYRDEQKRRVAHRLVKKGALRYAVSGAWVYYQKPIEARDNGEVK